MADGILIIDKPAGWTTSDHALVERAAAAAAALIPAGGSSFSRHTRCAGLCREYLGILSSAAEMNSACGKVLPPAKRLYGAKAPDLGAREALYG